MGCNKNVIDFYKKYSSQDLICTHQAHDDWARVVSGLKSVQYRSVNRCNIVAVLDNVQNVLNELLHVASFEELVKRLIDCKIQTKMNRTGVDELTFSMTNYLGDKYEFQWNITGHHSGLSFNKQITETINVNYQQKILNCIRNSQLKCFQGIDSWSLAMLLFLFGYKDILLTNGTFPLYYFLLGPINLEGTTIFEFVERLQSYPNMPDEIKREVVEAAHATITNQQNEGRLNNFLVGLLSVFREKSLIFFDSMNDKAKRFVTSAMITSDFMEKVVSNKWILDTIQKMPNSSNEKIEMCQSFLVQQIPDDGDSLVLIISFYQWLFDEQNRQFKDKVYQQNLSNLFKILKRMLINTMPNNMEAKKFVEKSFAEIYDTLSLATYEELKKSSTSLINCLISAFSIRDPRVEELFKPILQLLIKKNIINIIKDLNGDERANFISILFCKPIPPQDKTDLFEFVQAIYAWIITTTNYGSYNITSFVSTLLGNDSLNETIPFTQSVYDWVIDLMKNSG